MPDIEHLDWGAIRAEVLPAWEETERRGRQLLFVLPLFGGFLSVGAFFAIRQTPLPALLLAAGTGLATLYLARGRRRLRDGRARVLSGNLTGKYTHTSTSPTRERSIRHYLKINIAQAVALTRTGEVEQVQVSGETETFSTTTGIYSQVHPGDDLTVIIMPHDRAIYFLVRPPDQVFPDGEQTGGSA
jgi:hypothetical protein